MAVLALGSVLFSHPLLQLEAHPAACTLVLGFHRCSNFLHIAGNVQRLYAHLSDSSHSQKHLLVKKKKQQQFKDILCLFQTLIPCCFIQQEYLHRVDHLSLSLACDVLCRAEVLGSCCLMFSPSRGDLDETALLYLTWYLAHYSH